MTLLYLTSGCWAVCCRLQTAIILMQKWSKSIVEWCHDKYLYYAYFESGARLALILRDLGGPTVPNLTGLIRTVGGGNYVLLSLWTMPRGRMQHTAALPRGKSCSAYAASAITSTWKKNFLQTFFRLQKLWNETGELWFFSQTGWFHFETPYLSYAARLPSMGSTICRSNF